MTVDRVGRAPRRPLRHVGPRGDAGPAPSGADLGEGAGADLGPTAAFVDLDGTLVDTAYLHTTVWCQALDESGEPCSAARVHRLLGLDAKELLHSLLGRFDPAIAERHDQLFAACRSSIRALPGADEFLREMHERGVQIVVLTTGRPAELPAELGSLHSTSSIDDVVGMCTTGVRPGSDLLAAALLRGAVRPEEAMVVTSTAQGAAEARAHGVHCVGVETGGLDRRELLAAGATEVYPDLGAFLESWRERVAAGVPLGGPAASVEVVVEIPARTRNKYELDEESGTLRLDRQLPASLAYPADYGFVPGTCAEDGDPLDAVVLLDEPVVPGTVVRAAPLGIIWVEDDKGRDPKLVTVLHQRAVAEHLRELDDLPEWRLAELEHFFAVYKQLEDGKSSRTCGFGGRVEAWRELHAARQRHAGTQGEDDGVASTDGGT